MIPKACLAGVGVGEKESGQSWSCILCSVLVEQVVIDTRFE